MIAIIAAGLVGLWFGCFGTVVYVLSASKGCQHARVRTSFYFDIVQRQCLDCGESI